MEGVVIRLLPPRWAECTGIYSVRLDFLLGNLEDPPNTPSWLSKMAAPLANAVEAPVIFHLLTLLNSFCCSNSVIYMVLLEVYVWKCCVQAAAQQQALSCFPTLELEHWQLGCNIISSSDFRGKWIHAHVSWWCWMGRKHNEYCQSHLMSHRSRFKASFSSDDLSSSSII